MFDFRLKSDFPQGSPDYYRGHERLRVQTLAELVNWVERINGGMKQGALYDVLLTQVKVSKSEVEYKKNQDWLLVHQREIGRAKFVQNPGAVWIANNASEANDCWHWFQAVPWHDPALSPLMFMPTTVDIDFDPGSSRGRNVVLFHFPTTVSEFTRA